MISGGDHQRRKPQEFRSPTGSLLTRVNLFFSSSADDCNRVVLYDNAFAFHRKYQCELTDEHVARLIPSPSIFEAAKKLHSKLNKIKHLASEQKRQLLKRRNELIQAIDKAGGPKDS